MVNWGDDQDTALQLYIERGDIDPHNLDGNYLYGKTVQLFPGYEGDGTAKTRSNVIGRLRKKLRNYQFDGTISGRRKRRAVGELFYLAFIFSTGSPRSHFLSSPLAHVSELVSDDGDDDDEDDDDDDDDDDVKESGMDINIQDQGASASTAKKAASAKKPSASKPDPTAAITSTLGAVSLQSPKCVRYNLSIGFPVLVSPTGYFRDGQRRICVDFLGIGMHFENNYKVETSGKTLKLFMRIPRRFVDPNRVDAELVHLTNDRDTIVSAQQDRKHGLSPVR
jgi:hypothetical protein